MWNTDQIPWIHFMWCMIRDADYELLNLPYFPGRTHNCWEDQGTMSPGVQRDCDPAVKLSQKKKPKVVVYHPLVIQCITVPHGLSLDFLQYLSFGLLEVDENYMTNV